MSNFIRGNRELIKALNQNLVLNIIRREEQLSRAQLTSLSGLSAGAVSQIIAELIQHGWLLDVNEDEYTGGRRRTLVRLNPDAGYALGLKLMEDRIAVCITDFACKVSHFETYQIEPVSSPIDLGEALARTSKQAVKDADIPDDLLLGIGIGVAGVIDTKAGMIRYSPYIGWHDIPLADIVSRETGLPVYIENDVNSLTITEHLFGVGKHEDIFAILTVGRGIGMGIVVNGQLYSGMHGGVGEIGHIMLESSLGYHGTLESLASDPAVIRYFQVHTVNTPEIDTLEEIVTLAQSGNKVAQQALQQSGHYLGIGLATIINMFCPPLIIVSGEGVLAGEYRLNAMYAAMKTHTFDGLLDHVRVVVEPTDDEAWARGAASLVISKVFASPLSQPSMASS